jgi:hypothetical protein
MAIIIKIAATLLIFVGVIWLLQGLGVLVGSMMSGDAKWAAIGGGMVIAGVAAWFYAGRRR